MRKPSLLSIYVHAIQGNSKKDMGIHMTTTDRLDKPNEAQSIIYGLQFYFDTFACLASLFIYVRRNKGKYLYIMCKTSPRSSSSANSRGQDQALQTPGGKVKVKWQGGNHHHSSHQVPLSHRQLSFLLDEPKSIQFSSQPYQLLSRLCNGWLRKDSVPHIKCHSRPIKLLHQYRRDMSMEAQQGNQ